MARMKVLNGPSIRRMPIYLYWLSVMQARGEEFASTTQLAEYIDLEPINVRKDIALTGVTGTVGVGYRVGDLIAGIARCLGIASSRRRGSNSSASLIRTNRKSARRSAAMRSCRWT